jgi:hypothetical protein
MRYFLLVYDRRAGRLLAEREFSSRDKALAARFECEETYARDRDGIEIVVLRAQSREQLERTHGRYFKSFAELATRIG